MLKIGDKVKTNDYYMESYNWLFKKNPITAGTVTNINKVDNHTIVEVKPQNGRKRTINELFLELA